jgi:hypothetical protein
VKLIHDKTNLMPKLVLRFLAFLVILSSCVSSAHRKTTNWANWNGNSTMPAVTSDFGDVDTSLIMQPPVTGKSPASLMELPRTEEGAFVLSPGFYEADFKTFCLQPGTPGPSSRDVYFQAPLKGARKEMIHSILLNSRKESHLEQKHVQLLLWSVVSHSDYHKLSPEVQFTARQLLSPKQLFELQGGMLGLIKTVAATMPSSGNSNELRKLFDLSVRSYEAFEQIAVVNTPSRIRRTDITNDHWYSQPDGYFVRYIPSNYKQTKIQVYMPEGPVNTPEEPARHIIFDPASWVVVPANSNAQRLGIGGPVLDIVRSVIRQIETGRGNQQPKLPNPPKSPTRTGENLPPKLNN